MEGVVVVVMTLVWKAGQGASPEGSTPSPSASSQQHQARSALMVPGFDSLSGGPVGCCDFSPGSYSGITHAS